MIGKLNRIPATKEIDKCLKEEEGSAKHAEDSLRRVTQRTAATVQWMVFESDSGDFDAEAPVGSAIYEVRSEGIQCRFWEAWLNEYTAQFCRATSFPDYGEVNEVYTCQATDPTNCTNLRRYDGTDLSASLEQHNLDVEEAPIGGEDRSHQISVEVSNRTFS